MSQARIRIGVIGANAEYGWSPRAHMPALLGLQDYEVAAICTTHEDTSRAAARKFNVPLAFHDHLEMLARPDIEAVSVVVKAPLHYRLSMDALNAGKHVYTEWPLGADLKEARELADLAAARGVCTMVGLQGRCSPELLRLKELVAEGYVGEVISCRMGQYTPGILERPSDRSWQRDRKLGAGTLNIVAGHALDCFCMCVGEFAEVSAVVATQVKQWRETDTGHMVDVTAPDNVLVSGTLSSGAVASANVASVPYHASGYSIEVYGREGTLVVTQTGGAYAWMGEVRLQGARGRDGSVQNLSVPERLAPRLEGVPPGPPLNVARMYLRFAEAIRTGGRVEPDFKTALVRHELLEAIQRSSDEGRMVALQPTVEGV
ncbi:MAG: Gfo/Idh/MocA family oxidoreductase [Chloroflexota bacterium]|nr:Gfo/Idh/MocA family oxidoreductase [Chloroflexota bacterium]